jgi:carboxylate-amine ligase
MGVEEELLLVDPATGEPQPVSGQAMAADDTTSGRDGEIEQELFLEQLETNTEPNLRLDDIDRSVRHGRWRADKAAAEVGAAIAAVPTPVLPVRVEHVTPKARYERIAREFGRLSSGAMVAGMHVHVGVSDAEEAVGVIDRIRPWLPVLLALSANSPYWLGVDTEYASWRTQVWRRWPAAGQSEPYGDLAGYRRATDALIASGAALDRGMLYLDARLSEHLPTVEIRVSDVCTEVEDVCLVAALTRALADTAAREWAAGAEPPVWRTDLLRAAHWKASWSGLAHDLVDPVSQRPVPARDAVEAAIRYGRDSLDEAGDTHIVQELFERLVARGAGAARQRAVAAAHDGDLVAVVLDLVERTRAAWAD